MHYIRVRQFFLNITVLVLLAACAGPSQVRLADGTMAYRIECDGTAAGLNYCFERAGKSCGAAGYSVVDQNGAIIASSAVASQDAEALVRSYSSVQNTMLVKCGP